MSNENTSVLGCLAKVCSNNHGGECSTFGVNIGAVEPVCDAFVNNGVKSDINVTTTKIGTCNIKSCYHNTAHKCTCRDILMMFQVNRALCASYQPSWLNEYSL